jgi:hypothetical protein
MLAGIKAKNLRAVSYFSSSSLSSLFVKVLMMMDLLLKDVINSQCKSLCHETNDFQHFEPDQRGLLEN